MGDAMGIEFRAGYPSASSSLDTVRKHAGDWIWLFEETELEADGYERYTTLEGKAAWRKKPEF